jgi:hypothetical protein
MLYLQPREPVHLAICLLFHLQHPQQYTGKSKATMAFNLANHASLHNSVPSRKVSGICQCVSWWLIAYAFFIFARDQENRASQSGSMNHENAHFVTTQNIIADAPILSFSSQVLRYAFSLIVFVAVVVGSFFATYYLQVMQLLFPNRSVNFKY